jgi:Uncharacterized ATPase, putative transposase
MSNTQQYPQHYSPDDITKIRQIAAWLKETGMPRAQLARKARVSGASLTQIMSGSYVSSPSALLEKLESAMRHTENSTNMNDAVETSVYTVASACCRMARQYRNFSVFSAYVGTGKTHALWDYERKHGNTHMIEATPSMTVSSLIKKLDVMVTGYTTKGNLNDKEEAIIRTLQGTDSLLIIDEAETLTPTQLHTIRRIRDIGRIGVVLAGTEHLSGILRPHSAFDQIHSRVGFRPKTITGITLDDTTALLRHHLGEDVSEDVISRIHKYCKGSARMVCEGFVPGIRSFQKDSGLDVRLVDSVASQALSLQSLA